MKPLIRGKTLVGMRPTRLCTNINVPCERLNPIRSLINTFNTYESLLGDFESMWGDSNPIRSCANRIRSCGRQKHPLSKQLQGQDHPTHCPTGLCIFPFRITENTTNLRNSNSFFVLLVYLFPHQTFLRS